MLNRTSGLYPLKANSPQFHWDSHKFLQVLSSVPKWIKVSYLRIPSMTFDYGSISNKWPLWKESTHFMCFLFAKALLFLYFECNEFSFVLLNSTSIYECQRFLALCPVHTYLKKISSLRKMNEEYLHWHSLPGYLLYSLTSPRVEIVTHFILPHAG